MIVLCEELQNRLDSVWYRLQRFHQEQYESIGQIDLDEVCIEELEKMIWHLETKQLRDGHGQ